VTADAELPEDLSEVLAHLEAAYPDEGCGLILRAGDGAFRVRPMENAYDRYKKVDPEGFPRTARTAYCFLGREQQVVEAEREARGERLCCIFHSHADVGAYFSAEDEAMAAPDGQPLWPGVPYLVVAVDAGKATAARLFWWNGGGFSGREVPITKKP
jgi:proteasome lid subunit RPN8/RPN11